MKVPTELQQVILSELPSVLEQIDDATKQIYDPNTIWLEAIQFADYVEQFGKHLADNHGPDCISEISEGLVAMSSFFKYMGEKALKVLDETEDINGTQF